MGTSTDAYLGYGIDLGEECIFENDDDYSAIENVLMKYDLRLVNHCSDGYPMWIIAYNDSLQCASRGYPEVVDPQKMVKLDWNANVAFTNFWANHKNDSWSQSFKDKIPQWLLFSFWG